VHAEDLVVGFRAEDSLFGMRELDSNQDRFEPADDQEDKRRRQVAAADVFMID
jgi:hypothetical protein